MFEIKINYQIIRDAVDASFHASEAGMDDYASDILCKLAEDILKSNKQSEGL